METSDELRGKGRDVLRTFAGSDYMQKRDTTTNAFNAELRSLSEYCLGAVWARPELPLKTRSMLCIAMLTALGRPEELRIHIEGAFNNGCTAGEVKEVILQSVLYCGFPAAGEANRMCEEIMARRDMSK